MTPALRLNTPEYSVTELSLALKRTVETAYDHVRVRGEISGWKRHASGHCYFCLKDAGAALDGVLWRTGAAGLAFRPEDGLEVVATGKLSTYPGRSKYQLVVERMEPAGVGALLAQLERRKAALAAEGLFAPERKRALPYLPATIGVVTSPTGAVIRDILHRLADRFPRRVLVWPVAVQGEGAAAQIAAAIAGFNAAPPGLRPDLLIVARGGGSIEDLWAFNEEAVVRAIAASAIPTISAVGHETDTTLADLAADRRAPTPTAAAEMAVPVRAELIATVTSLAARADRCATRHQTHARERATAAACRLPSERDLLALARQRVDDLAERLPRGLDRAALAGRAALDRTRLTPLTLARRLDLARRTHASATRALAAAGSARLAAAHRAQGRAADPLRPALLVAAGRVAERALAAQSRLLESLSPLATLGRGYAVVERDGGGVVASAAAATTARRVQLRFHDGRVAADIRRPTAPRARASQDRLL